VRARWRQRRRRSPLYWRTCCALRTRGKASPSGTCGRLMGCCDGGGASTRRIRHSAARTEQERSRELAEWHGLVLENVADTDGGLLDRIAWHAALGGPEQTFFSARLAHRRGNTDVARNLTAQCLQKLPGHNDFREFAAEIGAAAPVRGPQRPVNSSSANSIFVGSFTRTLSPSSAATRDRFRRRGGRREIGHQSVRRDR